MVDAHPMPCRVCGKPVAEPQEFGDEVVWICPRDCRR